MPYNCKNLAEKYATLTSIPIPDSDVEWYDSDPSKATRSKWMLSSEWHCVSEDKNKLISRTSCATPIPNTNPVQYNTIRCETVCDQSELTPLVSISVLPSAYNPTPSAGSVDTAAMFRVLKEEGFIHWVNSRGMKCINRVIGVLKPPYPLDTYNTPFVPQENNWFNALPAAHCQTFCNKVRPDSEACFACVNLVLQKDPSLCRFETDLNQGQYVYEEAGKDLASDDTLLQECIKCQRCLGEQAGHDQNDDSPWKCVTGDIKEPLTPSQIILIVAAAIFVVAVAVFFALHYYFKKRKISSYEQDLETISRLPRKAVPQPVKVQRQPATVQSQPAEPQTDMFSSLNLL